MRNLNHKELANLVILSQKGDADAFSELYALTYQGQFYAANQIMKDAYLAEDIIQEVYIRLYQTIERIEKPQGFLSYLNRMTYHACISYKRKRFYNSENSVDQDFLDSFQDYAMLPTPEKHTLSNERSQIVADALKQLSDESRCAILMRYSEDLKIKEIAEILDCSTSTVKRRINASKELLKAYLDEHKMRGFLFTPFLGSLLSLSKNASPLTEASAENILQNTLMTSGHPAPDGILKLAKQRLERKKKRTRQQQGTMLFLIIFCLALLLLLTPAAINSRRVQKEPDHVIVTPIVDTTPPALTHFEVTEDRLIATFSDTHSAVNFNTVYGITASGTQILPISINADSNQVVFDLPTESIDVYISDTEGNTGVSTIVVGEH